MMIRWSGEVQVNVSGMSGESNLNLSLTLVDVKLVQLSGRGTGLRDTRC